MKEICCWLAVAVIVVASGPEGGTAPFKAHSVVDTRIREYLSPTRVVWVSSPDQCSVKDPEMLLEDYSGQITLESRVGCLMKNEGKPPSILLDFGRELQGGIEISVAELTGFAKESKTVRVRIRFGESVSEAMSELGEEQNATNDHAVRDDVIRLPWLGSAEFGNTGFRFVKIDLLDAQSSVTLKAVRAIYSHRDLPRLGSFRCNDERLNRIWETGAYTVFLNMQTYLWDGIKRDRLVWIGDMHPETSTIGAVFGPTPVVARSLDLVRDETPPTRWMNGISSYSMWWIIIHRDWYRQTGDLNYLRQQHGYLKELLKQLQLHIKEDGAESLPAMRFLDWPSSESPAAIHAGLQSLMVLSFEAGSDVAQALGDESTSRSCEAAVERLRKHVPSHGNSKQAAALLALAGLADPEVLNREVMAKDGGKRLSTFYGYYVLQARAKAGDYQGCLENIREFWGSMLDLGATTFWEDFNLEWLPDAARIDELVPAGKKDIHGDYGAYCYKGFRHSLCHGWASGPTAWLSQHVLGVEVLAPGCSKIRVRPNLGDLQWVEGSYPTPKGVVKIRHEKQRNGKVKTTIEAPRGIRVER